MTPAALLDAVTGQPLAGGRLAAVRGLLLEASGLDLPVGAEVRIESGASCVDAEVVGFRDGRAQLVPWARVEGLVEGCAVWPRQRSASVLAGDVLLGRVVDPLGEPSDGGPRLRGAVRVPLYRAPVPPLERPLLDEALDTGVRSINGLATFARGQRMGLFAGSGVGKSTLLAQIARGTDAHVRVVGLVGERGREVREWVERQLGPAREATVTVAVPADASPLLRVRGAYAATAIAEYFRDCGRDVLLLLDSITSFAMAAREIALARGEPATTKGYTPSVFAALPGLLERAGRTPAGSITAVYTVLVEGDDLEDPLVDALRATLDGHVVLSRDLAERGHFPAVDVLASVSHAMPSVTSEEHRAHAVRLRRLLAAYRGAEDLIQVGAYAKGSDAVVDEAIARRAALEAFLCQGTEETTSLAETRGALARALEGRAS